MNCDEIPFDVLASAPKKHPRHHEIFAPGRLYARATSDIGRGGGAQVYLSKTKLGKHPVVGGEKD